MVAAPPGGQRNFDHLGGFKRSMEPAAGVSRSPAKHVLVLILLSFGAAVFLLPAAASKAGPTEFDPTYGDKGAVNIGLQLPNPNGTVKVLGMAVGPADETFVLSAAHASGSCGAELCLDLYVARFRSDGTRDLDFVSRSGVVASVGQRGVPGGYASYSRSQAALAVAPDGGVIVAAGDGGDAVLVKLRSDGTRDATFGQGGRVATPLGTEVTISSVGAQRDGRIVVAGKVGSGPSSRLLVARYLASGVPDRSFGGGFVYTSPGFDALPAGIALQNGNAVVAAPLCCAFETSLAPLTVFGNDGGIAAELSGQAPERFGTTLGVGGVIARPNGSIKVVGASKAGAYVKGFLPDQRQDRGFGNGGVALIRNLELYPASSGVVRDGRGRIVVAGYTASTDRYHEPSQQLTVTRLLPNGQRDPAFGQGKPVSWFSGGDSYPLGMGIQSDGRIMMMEEARYQCIRGCEADRKIWLVRLKGGGKFPSGRCRGQKATIAGTRLPETLVGTKRRDVIAGLGGDDVIRGLGGNDLICGGGGNDSLYGGGGRDRLFGGSGRNQLHP